VTNRQRIFIEEYIKCWNGAEAARRAGYKNPDVAAFRLIRNDKISQIIEERIAEKCMDADEVLIRLAGHARGIPADCIDEDGFVKFEKLKEAGLLHLVKKVKRHRSGGKGGTGFIEIEFYDQQRAMELIGKHLKMWTERHEVTGKDGEPVKVTMIEVIRPPEAE